MPNETILVVDDNKDFANTLITYMLKPAGYTVLYAFNGKTGLEMAVSQSPDLILLDMNMPVMSGLETLQALRESRSQTPVIFMTLHGSEHVAVEAFRLKVSDYLVKPFSTEELKPAMDAALKESRLAREKEKLAKNLLISETIRQTVVTLSHYINNDLMVLSGGLDLLQESLPADLPDQAPLFEIIKDSRGHAEKIKAVLRVLQKVTNAQLTTYYGQIKMIDIEAALKEELAAK